ncbi:hypothetical protein [Chitinophaga caseinilytica]|uniref:hypothetical protein n=1 Tax=Chitinophaga caseinilytica TaxID=2267521 RepID=UPI003C2BC6A8
MNKSLLYLIGILLSACPLRAQINFNYIPAVNGQTLDGLAMVQVVNNGGATLNGALNIRVKDGAGRVVVNIDVPKVSVLPGGNVLHKGVLGNAAVRFGSSPAASLMGQSGRFPEGEYEYCFRFIQANAKPGYDPLIFENCFDHTIQPVSPLLLTDPFNGDQICNTRPSFSWQPPVPIGPDTRYRIVVAAVEEKQDGITALANNRPVINLSELRSQLLPYPPQAPDLEKGKQYAWQVWAYQGKTIITKSEIWQFTIQCDTVKNQKDSYREAKPALDGSFYLAKEVLYFSFNNPYRAGRLEYSIYDLSDPLTEIKKLPRVNMKQGINLVDLKLSGNKSFLHGHQYILKIRNAGNAELVLKFSYAE